MERKCDFCGEEVVEIYCEDCLKNNYLCKGCYNVAHKNDIKKAHKIKAASQIVAEIPCFCVQHPNEHITTVCLLENKPVCLKCINSGVHNGHQFGDFKTGFAKIVAETKVVYEECKKEEFKPDKNIAVLLDEDISKLKAMIFTVKQNFADLRKDLEKKEKELANLVELTLEERIKSRKLFDYSGSRLKTILNEYNSCINKGCTNGCKDFEILLQRIADLKKMKENLIEFKKMNDLVSGDYQAPSLGAASKLINEMTIPKEMLNDKQKILPIDTLVIKNPDQIKLLRQWISEAYSGKTNIQYELIYRATRDGMGNVKFHEKCDNKGATVIIIQSGSGNIFGGYTSQVWDVSNAKKYNATDFIFSITHGTKLANHKIKKYTIRCEANFGPIFGRGYDISIWQNGNTTASGSHSNGNNTFELPTGVDPRSYLAGSYTFSVTEMEVYALKN